MYCAGIRWTEPAGSEYMCPHLFFCPSNHLRKLYLEPPIRPINSPFPEFQAARRVKHLTPAVAGYPLVTLTRV